MSYDFEVYAPERIGAAVLAAVLTELELSTADEDVASGLAVVTRGARSRYCFHVTAALDVEPEDVHPAIVARALGCTSLVQVSVEGSLASEIPHARRFVKRLAALVAGAAVDRQTEEVWTRAKSRAVSRPPIGKTDLVELRWYVLDWSDGASTASAWLELARKHLPEAVPRRFGDFEPLQRRLERDGDEAFIHLAGEKSGGGCSFTCAAPVLEGGLATTTGRAGATVASHRLTLLREPLTDPRWADATRDFFAAFAHATGAFFASAEVVRDAQWSGRQAWHGREQEPEAYPAWGGKWWGLPPYPLWLSWFGDAYAGVLRPDLPPGTLVERDQHLLLSLSDTPVDRDQLAQNLGHKPKWRFRGRPTFSVDHIPEWLPADYVSMSGNSPGVVRSPLRAATNVPRGIPGAGDIGDEVG